MPRNVTSGTDSSDGRPSISVVIPTKERSSELAQLLTTLAKQSEPPIDVVVIDDSGDGSTSELVKKRSHSFRSQGCELKYLRGDGEGITSARNIGVMSSRGDAVLFLDDDTLLEENVIQGTAEFLRNNPQALGVQPRISGFAEYWAKSYFGVRLENHINKIAMITYHEPNRLSVRRSGAAVFPSHLTKVIPIQRMMGCSFCLRRSVLSEFSFDTNLKKWGCYDDLDLTYRIYKKYPGSLFAIPNIQVVHTHSNLARLPSRQLHHLSVVYWFYIFFKDLSHESLLNSLAFIWAMMGSLFWNVMGAFVSRDRQRLLGTAYLISDYGQSLWHLRSIRKGELEFFNRTLR